RLTRGAVRRTRRLRNRRGERPAGRRRRWTDSTRAAGAGRRAGTSHGTQPQPAGAGTGTGSRAGTTRGTQPQPVGAGPGPGRAGPPRGAVAPAAAAPPARGDRRRAAAPRRWADDRHVLLGQRSDARAAAVAGVDDRLLRRWQDADGETGRGKPNNPYL